MEESKFVQVGGSVEKALAGDYSLDVKAILKEGWALTKTTKLPILVGLSYIFVFTMILVSLFDTYMGGIGIASVVKDGVEVPTVVDPEKFYIIQMLAIVVTWPFLAGIEMMGVSHAVGIKTKSSFVFAFLKRSAFVALAAVIITLLSSLGFTLLFIPGVYLTVALSLTIPLVIEKQMSPVAAILLTLKATRFQWFKIFYIYLVLFALAISALIVSSLLGNIILSMAVFITSIIWLAPMFYNIKGILYREIFGLKVQISVDQNNNNTPDSYFTA